ncbi:MAG TPA: NYN domain-containing protein [Gemmatimonadota bacterium]|nr:NYN domain-containing protein [Gemmatimonadota bacterium]
MQGPHAVLVDGYNVLHAIPRFAPRGRELDSARTRFEAWLAEAAARAGVERCVLVWDGRAGSREKRAGRLTVLYTAAGTSADDRILDLCRGPFASRRESTWVVSSDGDVREPARQLGFATLGAMEFYLRWKSPAGTDDRRRGDEPAARPRRRSSPPEERPTRASRAEVDELLAEFLNADRERE